MEKLHQKQDKLQNLADFHNARSAGNQLAARTQGVINLKFQWVLGHEDFTPNERADEEAKKATKGHPSASNLLPKLLRKSLPHSILALCQDQKAKIHQKWLRSWKASPKYLKRHRINKTTPSKKWLQLVVDLTNTPTQNRLYKTKQTPLLHQTS